MCTFGNVQQRPLVSVVVTGLTVILLVIFNLQQSHAQIDFNAGDVFSNCVDTVKYVNCLNTTDCFRSLDGTCNNLCSSIAGAANTELIRMLEANYADGLQVPYGYPFTVAPSTNQISRAVFEVHEINSQETKKGMSVLFMTFGQFLDHDISITPIASCSVSRAPIVTTTVSATRFAVRTKDEVLRGKKDLYGGLLQSETKYLALYRFSGLGENCTHSLELLAHRNAPTCESTTDSYQYPCFPIKFNDEDSNCTSFGRSTPVCQSSSQPRQFPNMVTSYIDGSGLYGTDTERLNSLRKHEGGLMLLDENELLPLVPQEDCNLADGCSLAGESRLDENIALNSVHTLWIREHNRIALRLSQINTHWNDEFIFEQTRKIIGALLQHVVYEEYLPHLAELPQYYKYNFEISAAISVAFSTSAFRFGHSLVPNSWAILDSNFDKIEDIHIRDTMNNITYIRQNGIENIIYGLLANQSQDLDTTFAHGVARTLMIPSSMSGYRDLTALNIQRGRDHGLQTYGPWRQKCNLGPIYTWEDLEEVMPIEAIAKLRMVYDDPNDIELYPAGISEYYLPNLQLGPLFSCILKDQFMRIRDGDRFFYKRPGIFTSEQLQEIKKVTFAKILCNNLEDIVSIQNDVFTAYNAGDGQRRECNGIPDMDLERWRDINN